MPPPPPPPDTEGGDSKPGSKTHGGDKKTGRQSDVANGHSANTTGAKTADKSDEIDMKVLDFLAVSQTVCMPLVQWLYECIGFYIYNKIGAVVYWLARSIGTGYILEPGKLY